MTIVIDRDERRCKIEVIQMSDREFWTQVIRGILTIVDALKKRFVDVQEVASIKQLNN